MVIFRDNPLQRLIPYTNKTVLRAGLKLSLLNNINMKVKLYQPNNLIKLYKESEIEIKKNGYLLINKHTFINIEEPYITVTYYSLGKTIAFFHLGENLEYFLIEKEKSNEFCNIMTNQQNDYIKYYKEANKLRNEEKTSLSSRNYAIKEMSKHNYSLPNIEIIKDIPSKI